MKKSSAKNFSRLRREQRGGRCVFTGCAANSGAGAAFLQAAPRTAGQALRFHRLRREQRGGRCVFTGCAANSGAGAAFLQAAPRTAGQALRFHRLRREQRGGSCVFTGCTANLGRPPAWSYVCFLTKHTKTVHPWGAKLCKFQYIISWHVSQPSSFERHGRSLCGSYTK